MKRSYLLFVFLLSLALAQSTYSQHLNFLGNDALTGTGAPAYGYGQFFSKHGNNLYVCNGSRINIFNVINPRDPVFLRNFTGGIYFEQVIQDSITYIAANTNGIRDYTLNNVNYPSPAFIGNAANANDAVDIAKVGDYLYVARTFYGLGTVNVTNPASPVLANTYNDGSNSWISVDAKENIIVAARDGAFRTFTRANPSVPQPAALVNLSSTPQQIYLQGNLLFLQVTAGADSGVSIYNVSNPASPTLITRISRNTTSYLVDGNYLYLASNLGGNNSAIYSYSIENLQSIVPVDTFYQTLGQLINMYRNNDVIYTERFDGSLRDIITFDILGEVYLVNQNGGDTLYVGDTETIQWSGHRTPGIARIELNRNYPIGDWEFVSDVPFSDSTYQWTVSGSFSNNSRFRIRSLTYSEFYDESNASFAIQQRELNYASPQGGITKYIADMDTIRWTHIGVTGNVQVAYNNSYPLGSWVNIGSADASTAWLAWQIAGVPATNTRYRITSQNFPTLSQVTPNDIPLQARTITVTYPNSGTVYIQDTIQIQWTYQNVTGNVIVELNRTYPTGAWTQIGTTNVTNGSLSYAVSGPTGSQNRIRVRSVNHPVAEDISNANFLISARVINVTRPNNTNTFYVLSNDTIRWTYVNITGNVRIELNRNYPSGSWEEVAIVPVANQFYVWNVTAPISNTARIKVNSIIYPWIIGLASSNFVIQANPNPFVTPPLLTFSQVPVNTQSTIQTVSIASRSQLPISVTSYGVSSSYFQVGLVDNDSTVTGMDSIRFQLTFSPDSILTILDTLRVSFSSPYSSINIPLSGLGIGAYFRTYTFSFLMDTTEAGLTTTRTLQLFNTGNIPLSPVFTGSQNVHCSAILPDTIIPANGSIIATIRFHPQMAGNLNGVIDFIAPGVDIDTISILLTGVGKTTPSVPQNLIVTNLGENANLNWNPVTTSIYGYPIVTDRYLVFFNASSPYVSANFFYLNYTPGVSTFVHSGVVRHSPVMNYQIRAYLGDTGSFDNLIRSLPSNYPMEQLLFRLEHLK